MLLNSLIAGRQGDDQGQGSMLSGSGNALPLASEPDGAENPPMAPALQIVPFEPSRYGAGRKHRPVALIGSCAIVGIAFAALAFQHGHHFKHRRHELHVINLMPPPPPPPAEPDKPLEIKVAQPQIVVPPPIVQIATPVVNPVQTAPTPPPVQAAVVAPSPAPAPVRMAGPVDGVDLSTKMISATPPRYPLESRRKHEQGTVVLSVLLSLDGAVEAISVAQSSGFDRLDKAALAAVKAWRWSPTMRGGEAVRVKGLVKIPFMLSPAGHGA